MKNIYRIASLNIGTSKWDGTSHFTFNDMNFEVERYGFDFEVEALKKMIQHLSSQVDAIAIAGFPPVITFDERSFAHRQYLDVLSEPSSVPVCTGDTVASISVIKGLTDAIQNGVIQPRNKVFFPCGLMSLDAVRALSANYTNYLYYGDAYVLARIPKLVRHFDQIKPFARAALTLANLKDLKRSIPQSPSITNRVLRRALLEQLGDIENVYSRMGYLMFLEDDLEFIRGKNIIVPYSNKEMHEHILSFAPKKIVNLFPEQFNFSDDMNYAILDAMLRLKHRRTAALSVREWETLLDIESEAATTSRRYVMRANDSKQNKLSQTLNKIKNRTRRIDDPDFAFIVHPLALEDIARARGMSFLGAMPKGVLQKIERSATKLPGFEYGRISNIVSKKTGERVNGVIYALPMTPKMMKQEPTDVVYEKLHRLCVHAADQGAKIIGLGAYTKVIGDSGETVNKMSPIPVTTGNSLSASATLWAVHEALKKLNILKRNPKTQRFDATATVIGATGSIGRVSAKLLALVVDDLCLVAPRLARLQELALEIKAIAPTCRIRVSTDANDFAATSDVLVTATSAFDQKIVDINLLKPGCVVCDCSRPLDFTVEDALKRPDVLIIESGEINLPGAYDLTCDLGLPDKCLYACLGETAVLAMEKRYESFTLGRDLDWKKVKDIYKLSMEHGVQLAGIRGHAGFIHDREIQIVKDLARAKQVRNGATEQSTNGDDARKNRS